VHPYFVLPSGSEASQKCFPTLSCRAVARHLKNASREKKKILGFFIKSSKQNFHQIWCFKPYNPKIKPGIKKYKKQAKKHQEISIIPEK
jgi:hypothetical protein